MYRRAAACICLTVLSFGVRDATGQPAPLPTVTAESESWYLNGEPLLHEGNVYYPRGATIHFDRDEFVRSGFYRGIPLYSRTTIEPFSVVYVPLAGGLMQPYERLRVGDVAGTIGSLGPTLPTPVPSSDRRDARGMAPATAGIPQAAGPPTGLAGPTDIEGNPRMGVVAPPDVAVGTTGAVGTAGRVAAPPPAATSGRIVVLPRPRPLVTAARPSGVNGVFIEFQNTRWHSSGPATELDSSFTRIGEYRGLPVYQRRGDESKIYVPIGANVRTLLAQYSR